MKLRFLLLIAFTAFPIAAMTADEKATKHPTRDDVVGVEEQDKEMIDAHKKAQETLIEFVKAVQKREDGKRYLLKVKLIEGSEVEHVWLEPVKWNNPGLLGVLSVDPVAIKEKKKGDIITPLPTEITDWVILSEDGTKQGGFTVDVIERRQGEK